MGMAGSIKMTRRGSRNSYALPKTWHLQRYMIGTKTLRGLCQHLTATRKREKAIEKEITWGKKYQTTAQEFESNTTCGIGKNNCLENGASNEQACMLVAHGIQQ